MTRILVIFGFYLLATTSANAIEWWHDPARGCGQLEDWRKTERVADLPGCDGELPNGVPAGEVSMHDAKRALRQAEELLDKRKTEGVEAFIDKAALALNEAPSDPRVNWARPHFAKASTNLRNRLSQLKGN